MKVRRCGRWGGLTDSCCVCGKGQEFIYVSYSKLREHRGDMLTAEQQTPLQLLHIDDRYPQDCGNVPISLKKKHVFWGGDLNTVF